MNYKDFNVAGNDYVDLYSLAIGDYFMEDTYADVYEVESIELEDVGFDGKKNMQTVVKTLNLTENIEQDWFYDKKFSAYAPVLVKLTPKYDKLVQRGKVL